MKYTLEFEKPIVNLEEELKELKLKFTAGLNGNLEVQIKDLEERIRKNCEKIYSKLTPWQIVLIARHPDRPRALDFVEYFFDEFEELHGDRFYRDDPAIVGGIGRNDYGSFIFIAQQRGKSTRERSYRNFGMAHPEGYRKAIRMMKLAERFSLPVITIVDTPGAYPGIGAEERGQAPAIGECIFNMLNMKTSSIALVIGEGGSGGALAISIADKIFMLKYSIYSVISPEGCASILWRTPDKAEEAARVLRLTAEDLYTFGIIDKVIEEPPGGAHRFPEQAMEEAKRVVFNAISELKKRSISDLIEKRRWKYRRMGIV